MSIVTYKIDSVQILNSMTLTEDYLIQLTYLSMLSQQLPISIPHSTCVEQLAAQYPRSHILQTQQQHWKEPGKSPLKAQYF